MKRILVILSMFAAITYISFCAYAKDDTPAVISIALPDGEFKGIEDEETKILYKMLYEELIKNKRFNITGKEEIESILKMKKIEPSCRRLECLLKMAELTRASKVIATIFTRSMDKIVVEVALFDSATRRIVGTEYLKINTKMDYRKVMVLVGIKTEEKLFPSIKTEKTEENKKTSEYEFDKLEIKGEGESTVKKYYDSKMKLASVNEPITEYKLAIGLSGGGSFPLIGYENYGISYGFGGTLKLKIIENKIVSPFSIGGTAEVFPMVTPEGTYGTSEDILAAYFYFCYGFSPESSFNPYFTMGVGGYVDWLKVDTPLTGLASKKFLYLGGNAGFGAEISLGGNLCFTPEAKLHIIFAPGKKTFYMATHLILGGGLLLYF